jgi:hypothetical protein
LAERSDALVTVVSEERGEVSVMYGREIQIVHTAAALAAKVRKLQATFRPEPKTRVRRIVFGDLGLKSAALGLAVIFWSISFFLVGNSIRTVSVPVEFSNVPADTEITRLSTDTVQVQVRGSAWLLDSTSFNTLVARFDLSDKKEGTQTLSVNQSTLNLPPGLIVENISPNKISVSLVRPAHPTS